MFYVLLVRRSLSANIASSSSLASLRAKASMLLLLPISLILTSSLSSPPPLNRHDFCRPPHDVLEEYWRGDSGGWRRSGGSCSWGALGGKGREEVFPCNLSPSYWRLFFFMPLILHQCVQVYVCVYLPCAFAVFAVREQSCCLKTDFWTPRAPSLSQLWEVQVAISCHLLPRGRHLSLDVFSAASQLTHENCKALLFFLQLSKSE